MSFLKRGQVNGISLLLLLSMLGVGCASPTGGWDVGALLEIRPELAAIKGQRIGDLTPNPAWVDGRLVGVVCRFDTTGGVGAYGGGPGWSPEWAAQAVAAIDRSLLGVRLGLASEPNVGVEIEVQSIADPDAEGPHGLGDTLALCDVSPDQAGRARGQMFQAVIRLRRALSLPTGRIHEATQEEWIGALMHEFGHALGFAGHAAVGDSLVHLEQSRLRALGRLAGSGESIPTPNLAALYELEPGTELTRITLSPAGEAALVALLRRVQEREQRLGPALRIVSIAGDRQARLRWEWEGGLAFAIDFPNWHEQLSAGHPLDAVSRVPVRRASQSER